MLVREPPGGAILVETALIKRGRRAYVTVNARTVGGAEAVRVMHWRFSFSRRRCAPFTRHRCATFSFSFSFPFAWKPRVISLNKYEVMKRTGHLAQRSADWLASQSDLRRPIARAFYSC